MDLNKENARVQELLEMDKEQLVEMYLNELGQRKKFENEANWLDQLADCLRDDGDNQDELYKEYKETEKANKETHEKYFLKQ